MGSSLLVRGSSFPACGEETLEGTAGREMTVEGLRPAEGAQVSGVGGERGAQNSGSITCTLAPSWLRSSFPWQSSIVMGDLGGRRRGSIRSLNSGEVLLLLLFLSASYSCCCFVSPTASKRDTIGRRSAPTTCIVTVLYEVFLRKILFWDLLLSVSTQSLLRHLILVKYILFGLPFRYLEPEVWPRRPFR